MKQLLRIFQTHMRIYLHRSPEKQQPPTRLRKPFSRALIKLELLLWGSLLLSLVIITFFCWITFLNATGTLIISGFAIILILMLIVLFFQHYFDAPFHKIQKVKQPILIEKFLVDLAILRSNYLRNRYISHVTRQELLLPTSSNIQMIRQFATSLERTKAILKEWDLEHKITPGLRLFLLDSGMNEIITRYAPLKFKRQLRALLDEIEKGSGQELWFKVRFETLLDEPAEGEFATWYQNFIRYNPIRLANWFRSVNEFQNFYDNSLFDGLALLLQDLQRRQRVE